MEPMSPEATAIAVWAWFGNKLLWPTIDVIGEDLKKLYEKGRDRITKKAIEKTQNIDQPGQTNLRVTHEVFWNGAFADNNISAEYFWGVLASSRSKDWEDDTGVFYIDLIKWMSSAHLQMHYLVYRTLNKELIANTAKHTISIGQETELQKESLYVPLLSIQELCDQDLTVLFHGLLAKKLIHSFQITHMMLSWGDALPYLHVKPTSLGVQLFAIANNWMKEWANFAKKDFGDFQNVPLPEYHAQSIPVLLERAGLSAE